MKTPSLLLALFAAAACGRGKSPEVLASLPEFSMTAVGERTERPFGRADMRGRVWIADFVFTSCGGPCPMLTDRMAKLSKTLPPAVRLLSVTVDPETDTPAVLRRYANDFGADHARWVWLRGSMEDTYRLLYAGFRQPMSTDPSKPAAERVTHSTRFVLIGPDGGIRGFYDGLSDEDNAALARDARRLLEAQL
ncbi:MAG: SCO family protein [Elusimicrobia bacterium]|nr:SCO family protein [Elusimicrobiota bacterium]